MPTAHYMSTFPGFTVITNYMPPDAPMVNTVGVLIVPSTLVVKLVTMPFDEPMENSYILGEPDENRTARSEPEMMVVPRF